jgi:predicted 3-demethylubiquinone-9 3-methyltransferase (glyoxalase superfamily)
MQKIMPCLWFNGNADEAIKFYKSVFPDAKVIESRNWGEGEPGPAGQLLVATMEIMGERIQILNGDMDFPFSEAISLSVSVDTQEEVDRLWDALISGGGEPSQCGWLKDKFGLSWQIVPTRLTELLNDRNAAKSHAAMQAMLKMQKIEIAELEEAVKASA